MLEPRRREPARELRRGQRLGVDVARMLEYIGIRNLGIRNADFQFHLVVRNDVIELLEEVGAEESRLRDRDYVLAAFRELGESARQRRRRAVRLVGEAQLRITEVAVLSRFGVGGLATGDKGFERGTQAVSRRVVEFGCAVDRLFR